MLLISAFNFGFFVKGFSELTQVTADITCCRKMLTGKGTSHQWEAAIVDGLYFRESRDNGVIIVRV